MPNEGVGAMQAFYGRFTAAAILAAMAAPGAHAQAPGPTDAVTYIEVTPAGEKEAANLLRQLAATSRKEAGNVSYTVLQHSERPSQFAILETWSDGKALEGQGSYVFFAGAGALFVPCLLN